MENSTLRATPENVSAYEREKIELTVATLQEAADRLARYLAYADELSARGIAIPNKVELDILHMEGQSGEPENDVKKINDLAISAFVSAEKAATANGFDIPSIQAAAEITMFRSRMNAALDDMFYHTAKLRILDEVITKEGNNITKDSPKVGRLQNIDDNERKKIKNTITYLQETANNLAYYLAYADELSARGIAIPDKIRLDMLRREGEPGGPGNDATKITSMAISALIEAEKAATINRIDVPTIRTAAESTMFRDRIATALKDPSYRKEKLGVLDEIRMKKD